MKLVSQRRLSLNRKSAVEVCLSEATITVKSKQHIGSTVHVWQDMLVEALRRAQLEVHLQLFASQSCLLASKKASIFPLVHWSKYKMKNVIRKLKPSVNTASPEPEEHLSMASKLHKIRFVQ